LTNLGDWEILNLRKVKHWGYKFNYTAKTVDTNKIGELPDFSLNVLERIISTEHLQNKPDQLTVNVYESGAGIPQHVETHSAFEDGIVSLSLISPTVMIFKHPDGECIELLLKPRDLLIVTKEARYLWSHGINARKTDIISNELVTRNRRISMTFRKVKGTPCHCQYQAQCYSWLAHQSDIKNTPIEEKFVKDIYDTIAPHFSDTRYKPWPKIQAFLESLPVGSLVCDIGKSPFKCFLPNLRGLQFPFNALNMLLKCL